MMFWKGEREKENSSRDLAGWFRVTPSTGRFGKDDGQLTDLTWKTAMSSRKGLREMRTTSAAGTRYLIFSVRWSMMIIELVDTTKSTGDN